MMGWVPVYACLCMCARVCLSYVYTYYLPSVISARLVSTLPSMNLATASTAHTKPLTMDTLKRKLS